MRYVPVICMLACFCLPLSGQVPDAVIVSHQESFTLQSPQNGVYKVSSEVVVHKEEGLHQAVPVIYTDSFRSIASFSGEVESGGRKVKVGKKDLNTVSISTGLADDSYMSTYLPSGPYPLTVRYEYSVNFRNGVLSFPAFAPVSSEGVSVCFASYRLDLPSETEIVSYAGNVEALPPVRTKGRINYEWQVKDFQPIKTEFLMPPVRELVPLVYVAPVSFSYAGTTGRQADWKEYGLWLRSLAEGTDVLPDATLDRLRELTSSCASDLDKLRVLYRYLRDNTRYVAIELGSGKLRPIAADEVDRSGFGDCKALSNYLQAMLKAVGVPSVYYIISTRSKDLLPGFTSAGQMDHAMLAVPLRETGDTVFVECTNPMVPLGYKHENVAGHEILLLEQDGGKLARVGGYPDSLSRKGQHIDVKLASDGSASVNVSSCFALDFAEPLFAWNDFKPDMRLHILTGSMKLHPEDLRIASAGDNFEDYGKGDSIFCPEKRIDFSFNVQRYARVEGKRLFLPANPISKRIPVQKSVRQCDIVVPEGYTLADTVSVHIPVGYEVEGLPEEVRIDSPWAEFRSTAQRSGNCVTLIQTIVFKRSRTDKSTYPDFRYFARQVNRFYDASVVLNSL